MDKLIHRFGQAGIESPLFLNCGDIAALVVMAWANESVTWQGKDLLMDIFVEKPSIALLKVRPPTTTDQEGITGEGKACSFGLQQKGHTAISVPGSGAGFQAKIAKVDLVSMPDV